MLSSGCAKPRGKPQFQLDKSLLLCRQTQEVRRRTDLPSKSFEFTPFLVLHLVASRYLRSRSRAVSITGFDAGTYVRFDIISSTVQPTVGRLTKPAERSNPALRSCTGTLYNSGYASNDREVLVLYFRRRSLPGPSPRDFLMTPCRNQCDRYRYGTSHFCNSGAARHRVPARDAATSAAWKAALLALRAVPRLGLEVVSSRVFEPAACRFTR
jgi:hypothetical protein